MQKRILSLSPFVLALACLAGAAADAAADTSCLVPPGWTALDRMPAKTVSARDLLADMAGRDVVLLGESHDRDDHHRWQVHTLAALHLLRPDMVIGFEMFPRRAQPALDKWVAGELTLKDFLNKADWDKVWNMPPDLYVPLFQFARIHRIPMVALNVDKDLSRAVRAGGWDSLTAEQREGVGKAAAPATDYLDFLFEVYRAHPPGSAHAAGPVTVRKTDRDFLNFVESQTAWDRAMAEALAAATKERPRGNEPAGKLAVQPLVVGIMGSGHVRYGHGVPHQLRDLGITRIGSLLAMPASSDCTEIGPGLADAVYALPHQPEDNMPPPRLGVQLVEKDGGVYLAGVAGGSLAESSGLKSGDRVLEIGGQKPARNASVAAAIRRQPPGSWLPVRVEREGKTLDLVIKFPVEQ